MEKSGKPYGEALKEAQQKGYAETNPASDVNGSDAEAKLLLLSLVGFGLQIQPGTIWRKGIEDIQAVDFRYAKRIGGSTIKQRPWRGARVAQFKSSCHPPWFQGKAFSAASTAR
jgi:homoserine dehydrogenase